MKEQKDLHQRNKLPYEIPPWVQQGARHFITINCRERGSNSPCKQNIAGCLLESASYYEKISHWYIWIMVIMPDHLHFIAAFNFADGLQAVIKTWKKYQTRNPHIEWQTDFFEHRLRNDNELIEKMQYVRMNPVRNGLVDSSNEWPFMYIADCNLFL